MSATTSTPLVGRGPLLGIGALLAATLVVAAGWRLAELPTRTPDAATVALRELRFDDAADGGVLVIDHASGATIETVHGEQGFLRGSLRGLVRERRKHGVGAAVPFQLIGRADGRVTLSDPATGARIDLESFGPSNAAVYTRWLAGSTGAAQGAHR
jgi:putative photosynthetic complex assembly protein